MSRTELAEPPAEIVNGCLIRRGRSDPPESQASSSVSGDSESATAPITPTSGASNLGVRLGNSASFSSSSHGGVPMRKLGTARKPISAPVRVTNTDATGPEWFAQLEERLREDGEQPKHAVQEITMKAQATSLSPQSLNLGNPCKDEFAVKDHVEAIAQLTTASPSAVAAQSKMIPAVQDIVNTKVQTTMVCRSTRFMYLH